MKKYLTYFDVSFRAFFTYKADFLVGIVFSLVYFLIYFALWKAVFATNGQADIRTYTLNNTITYYFIITLIFRLNITDALYMGSNIWNGDFTNDLIKPWNVILVHIITTLSELGIQLLLYLPFAIFIFVFAFNYIDLPGAMTILLFIATLALGLFLSFAINLSIHALTFHLGDQEGNVGLVNYLISFLAGGVFPLTFLSPQIKAIFLALPFRYLFDFPANIFLGKVQITDVYIGWLQMFIWGLAFMGLFMIIYRTGLKKYTGVGR